MREWGLAHFGVLRELETALGKPVTVAHPAQDEPDVAGALELAAIRGDDPVDAALGTLLHLTGAQRGFIASRETNGQLRFAAARAFGELTLEAPEAQISSSILDLALLGERPVLIDDAVNDAQFATPSVDRLALRTVLVVPLITRNRAMGVLYLDDPTRAAAFSDAQRRAAEAFAHLVAPRLAEQLDQAAQQANAQMRAARLASTFTLTGFVARDPALLSAVETALRTAGRAIPLLIAGPRGSGRLALCRLAHRNGVNPDAPFVVVDAASASGRQWESALTQPGATVVFREVDTLPADAQLELAARIDACPTAGRVCATCSYADTLAPQLEAVARVVEIEMPALQARVADIVPLAMHALATLDTDRPGKLSPASERLLESLSWPGNVSELFGVVRRAAAASNGTIIERRHVVGAVQGDAASSFSSGHGLKSAVRAFRRRFVARVLEESDGDHSRAARVLGVHPKYLYKLLRELREP